MFWADLEKQFHQFFYSGVHEMKLTDLTNLRQRNDESVVGALVWFYLISSLQKLLSKDSCDISRRSMLLKSSTASVRWLIE